VKLKAGDVLNIDWLCLDGCPRSSYRIVAVDGNHMWYYRTDGRHFPDDKKVASTTIDSIDEATKRGELAVQVSHTVIGLS